MQAYTYKKRYIATKIMNKELVSVIMPTYNAGKYLADSINCILRQTHRQLELLITDDGSNDHDTLDILHRMEQADNRVKVTFLKENHGAGYARNEAIHRAKGRYIAFCDADDRWMEDKLEVQLSFMHNRQCAISCSSYVICNSLYKPVGINIPPRRITPNMMKRDNKIGCLTAIYDVEALGKKYEMPTLRKRQDWAMFIELTQAAGVAYAYTEKPLAYYCDRQGSVSSSKLSLIKYNIAIYSKILHFGILKSLVYFIFLFLPTYVLKLMKRKIDWIQYKRHRNVKL